MNTMTLDKSTYVGRGSFGSYYDLGDGTGVKVLNQFFSKNQFNLLKDFEEFLNIGLKWQPCWFRKSVILSAAQECAAMQMLSVTGRTPKILGLVWVHATYKDKDGYRVGILMEHINGKTFLKVNKYLNNKDVEKMISYFNRFGFYLRDWHDENVMLNEKNQFIRIDFSAGYFKVSKRIVKKFCQIASDFYLELMENVPEDLTN